MKKIVSLLLIILLLFTSCTAPTEEILPPTDAPVVESPDEGEQVTDDTTDDFAPSEGSELYEKFGCEFNTDYHPIEEVEAIIDPDFELEEYGATGLGGAGTKISCMSFNVLSYDTHQAGYAEPAERAELVVRFIREQNADLVGLQEVTTAHGYDWVKTLKEGLSDLYDFRMVTEEEGEVPYTSMSIATGLMFLYKKDRFELKESGGFEYWDDTRACHWILLQDKTAGRELYFTNTHFSIDGGSYISGNIVRSGEAIELLNFWQQTVGDTALFATGDYNCKVYDDPQIAVLQKSIYQPSCEVALESDGTSTVDFCYVNTKALEVESYDFMDKAYPTADGSSVDMSDHNPVMTVAMYK